MGNVDEIQGGAFKTCKNLREIKFNGAVTKIDSDSHGAFENCKSLTGIKFRRVYNKLTVKFLKAAKTLNL